MEDPKQIKKAIARRRIFILLCITNIVLIGILVYQLVIALFVK